MTQQTVKATVGESKAAVDVSADEGVVLGVGIH